jgi:Holliday junction resolvase-like predicted endonuclease
MRDNKITGQIGEFVAYCYFLLRGYKVLRDQKLGGVQVDLILSKKTSLILLEVKARRKKDGKYSVISSSQLSRLKTAAKILMARNDTFDVSIDVFVVYLYPLKLEHHKNVCDIG